MSRFKMYVNPFKDGLPDRSRKVFVGEFMANDWGQAFYKAVRTALPHLKDKTYAWDYVQLVGYDRLFRKEMKYRVAYQFDGTWDLADNSDGSIYMSISSKDAKDTFKPYKLFKGVHKKEIIDTMWETMLYNNYPYADLLKAYKLIRK